MMRFVPHLSHPEESRALPALIGDALRLGQILLNLANNAVKFTDTGEIIIGVEKVTHSDDQVELHFWVVSMVR